MSSEEKEVNLLKFCLKKQNLATIHEMNPLKGFKVYTFKVNFPHHIETSQLVCFANRSTRFLFDSNLRL